MNTQTQEALKMAIEALKWLRMRSPIIYEESEAEKACKEAILRDVTDIDVGEIAQPSQEPVAVCKDSIVNWVNGKAIDGWLYTPPAPHPAQEPVAWIEVTTHHEKYQTSKVILLDKGIKLPHDTLLYTHPAPSCQECENLKHDLEGYMDANKELINREWQGLSDDEIVKAFNLVDWMNEPIVEFARAIEQALKKKNGN